MSVTAHLQITVRDMPHSAALEFRIRRNVARLERTGSRITAFHVTVERPHNHRKNGSQFCVKLDVRVPGAEIVVTRDHDEDVYVALREAFRAARRQLVGHAGRMHGAEGFHRSRRQGVAVTGASADE